MWLIGNFLPCCHDDQLVTGVPLHVTVATWWPRQSGTQPTRIQTCNSRAWTCIWFHNTNTIWIPQLCCVKSFKSFYVEQNPSPIYVCMYASSIAQSVCQQAFSLLETGFQRPSGFESCIQQRKTTCLLSIKKSLACARASKLITNMYITRARCECQMAVGSGGLNACWSQGQAVEFKFLAWSSIAQSVCQQAFSLHSAEEDNLSPFD